MQSLDPHHADDAADDAADAGPDRDDPAYGIGAQGESGADATHHDAAPEVDDDLPQRTVPSAPVTGDPVVDAAMVELASAESGTLTERIDAGERAHRLLQGRLSDLGGA